MRSWDVACCARRHRYRACSLSVFAVGCLPFSCDRLSGVSWFSVGLFAAGGGMVVYIPGASSTLASFCRSRPALEDYFVAAAVAVVPAEVRIGVRQIDESRCDLAE